MNSNTLRDRTLIQIINTINKPVGFHEISKWYGKNKNSDSISDITLKRNLTKLVKNKILIKEGNTKAVKYTLSAIYKVLTPIDEAAYLKIEVDERDGLKGYNFNFLEILLSAEIFTNEELSNLKKDQLNYQNKIKNLSSTLINKEFERLIIELSWKSSAIEGNTYDLLETETLLQDGIKAKGKLDDEATMLINHKHAFIFIRENSSLFHQIDLPLIEKIHSLLVKNLNVSQNLRSRIVAITGTTYRPLDNQFQIKEALIKTCEIINLQPNPHIKAFLALVLISYIQPFEDGNKRTSRLLANAILLAFNSFPLSYRSIKVQDYKKAMLLFYEKNYLVAIKRIYLEQSNFASNTYFL